MNDFNTRPETSDRRSVKPNGTDVQWMTSDSWPKAHVVDKRGYSLCGLRPWTGWFEAADHQSRCRICQRKSSSPNAEVSGPPAGANNNTSGRLAATVLWIVEHQVKPHNVLWAQLREVVLRLMKSKKATR